jgi:uncharacterized repeat protein (TIGR03803 family)
MMSIKQDRDEIRPHTARVALALAAVLVSAVAFFATQSAHAQTFSVLYTFSYYRGEYPHAGVIRDPAGTLYGTTYLGGKYFGYGVVFRLTKAGRETILCYPYWQIGNGWPLGALIRDAAGNLYGTASDYDEYAPGALFKVDPAGNCTALYNFSGGADGSTPAAALTKDAAGNWYGTAKFGGVPNCGTPIHTGCGTVFMLDPAGNYTVLYSFTGGADGAWPVAALVRDGAGNLYSTASGGGAYGYGVVFKLDSAGNYTVLHSFRGGTDGGGPVAELVRDGAGNLYGTASGGGAYGYGVVFKLGAKGKYTVLYHFAGLDGANPLAGLVRDKSGNLYGTTSGGGAYGGGTVFKLNSTGQETLLYSFTGGVDGSNPAGRLLLDAAGNLFGTAENGGNFKCDSRYGCGVVFKIAPQ